MEFFEAKNGRVRKENKQQRITRLIFKKRSNKKGAIFS
jgi:hypothetical protein